MTPKSSWTEGDEQLSVHVCMRVSKMKWVGGAVTQMRGNRIFVLSFIQSLEEKTSISLDLLHIIPALPLTADLTTKTFVNLKCDIRTLDFFLCLVIFIGWNN